MIGKIAKIDLKQTFKIRIQNERQELDNKRDASQSSINSEARCSYNNVNIENTGAEIASPVSVENIKKLESANDFKTFVIAENSTSLQVRIRLPATVLTSDRFGVSDGKPAAIVSNVLHYMEAHMVIIIDKNCIRKEKIKTKHFLQKDNVDVVRDILIAGKIRYLK